MPRGIDPDEVVALVDCAAETRKSVHLGVTTAHALKSFGHKRFNLYIKVGQDGAFLFKRDRVCLFFNLRTGGFIQCVPGVTCSSEFL